MIVQVVHHQHTPGLCVRHQRLNHVLDKIDLRTDRPHSRCERLAHGHAEVADQRCCAMPRVLELPAFHLTGLHGRDGGHAFQRLQASHLVDADYRGFQLRVRARHLPRPIPWRSSARSVRTIASGVPKPKLRLRDVTDQFSF